ncbi:MAG: hypothetical protein HY644_13120 [Acidobacteria bacterium]|nr:hypothetical protein [Acidobacteriota bacterium]
MKRSDVAPVSGQLFGGAAAGKMPALQFLHGFPAAKYAFVALGSCMSGTR